MQGQRSFATYAGTTLFLVLRGVGTCLEASDGELVASTPWGKRDKAATEMAAWLRLEIPSCTKWHPHPPFTLVPGPAAPP